MQIVKIEKPSFVVFSNRFGYPMWSADVPDRPDVEITDQPGEIGKFGNLQAAQCMASALTKTSGYQWDVATEIVFAPTPKKMITNNANT